MKYFVIFITFFASIFNGPDCFIPDGYEVFNNLEENGVLSIVDKYGNGVDIYVDSSNVDIDVEIASYKANSHVVILEEVTLDNGGHLLRFEPQTKLYPVDAYIAIPGDGFIVTANLLKLGDPKAHEAFEKDVISMMRKIAQGGRDEKVWICWFGALFERVRFSAGEG